MHMPNHNKEVVLEDIPKLWDFLIKEISMYILEVAFEAKLSCDVTENTVVIKLEQQS
jgi:hypothetical protein